MIPFMVDKQEMDEIIEEMDEEMEAIAERLREIDDHHKYEHALESVIRNMLGHITDPQKEGAKCTSATLATTNQAITRMTVEVTGVPSQIKDPDNLRYIG